MFNHLFTTVGFILLGALSIAAVVIGLGIFHYSKYSLSIARIYIIGLLFMVVSAFLFAGYFFLEAAALLAILTGAGGLLARLVGGGIILLMLAIPLSILILSLRKIEKVLKIDLPKRKTFLSSYGKFSKLAYIPFILMLLWYGYAAFNYFHALYTDYQIANRDPYGTPVSADSPKIISESHTSPDNAYTVKEVLNPPIQIKFLVYDKDGNMITRVIYENNKEIDGDGDVHGCDCQVSFKGWTNNHTFVIKTIKEDGAEYEDINDIKKPL